MHHRDVCRALRQTVHDIWASCYCQPPVRVCSRYPREIFSQCYCVAGRSDSRIVRSDCCYVPASHSIRTPINSGYTTNVGVLTVRIVTCRLMSFGLRCSE